MGPKKGQGAGKGKQPAKRKAPANPPPVISSSEDEEWPDNSAILGKLSELERKSAVTQTAASTATLRRSHRESKVCRMSELQQLGDVMLLHIVF